MTQDITRSNRFGAYLRRQRIESGRSLREVAEAVGISHVYLGEVERGVRGPLKPDHWSALVRAIPGLTLEELRSHAEASRPLQLDVADAPARYQNLALALARRFERRDLSKAEIAKLLKVLKPEED